MENYDDMFKSICRVCLSYSNNENIVSLIDESSENELSCYGKAVSTFANIIIKPSENLPTVICENCIFLLKQAIYFKLQCESTQTRLTQLVKMSSVSGENLKEIVCNYSMFMSFFPEQHIKSNYKVENYKKNGQKDKKTHKVLRNSDQIISQNSCTETDIAPQNVEVNAILDNEFVQDYEEDLFDRQSDGEIDLNVHKSNQYDDDKLLKKLDEIVKIDMSTNNKTYNRLLKKQIKKCKKVQQQKLRQHNTTKHQKPKNFTCEVCHKVLANEITYDHHMQRHNGYRLMCEQCGKGFPALAELNMHQVAKHGIGPYLQCHHCSYKAPRKINLIEHIRLHTGERPYTCDKCGLTFRRKAIWRNHIIYHMEKNFQCPQCPRKFFRHSAMLEHVNNIHERSYAYMCNKCCVTYTKTETVRRHLFEKHGIPREMQGKILRISKGANNFPVK